MTLEEQRRVDAEKSSRALPDMVAELRAGTEPVEISRRIAEHYEIDQTKAFRWVQIVAESFERRRRRIAVLGTVLIWIGALVAVAGAVLALLGVAAPSVHPGLLPGYLVLVLLGALLLAGGLWLGFKAPRLAVVTEDTLSG
ncbi:MAG: hypothetical protein GVY23_03700 [Spirochaetes bacterium]|jgi:hypothetical protein|nr:hypothetical protein [Spirochaetota bacterium]